MRRTHVKYLSVKEYAKLIGKSNKTVYKMIDDGFVAATKEGKTLKVMVDTNLLKKYDESMQYMEVIQAEIKLMAKRIAALEAQSKPAKKATKLTKPRKTLTKKTVTKKAPLKSSKKSSVKKSAVKK